MGLKTQSSISLPQSITLVITTNADVNSSNLNRHLVFRNYLNHEISLKFTLNKDGSNKRRLVITDFPDTLHNLQVLGSMNHRSYWDRIYLKNFGGGTTIDIDRITLTVHYARAVSGAVKDIPLLANVHVNQQLAAGDEIHLTPFIENSVLQWANLTPGQDHAVAVMAGKELGKSGTSDEGFDEYGNNPKYRGWLGYECSEFVSWYLHADCDAHPAYKGFTNNAFKHITYTQQIHNLYKDKERSYYYHNGRRRFYNEVHRHQSYTPKAGDVLIRRGNGKAEHAMILVNWDSTNLKATVIDGPYLITLREVEVHELEVREENEKDFVICSVV